MSINVFNLKKWIKMLSGNSILHVNQGNGCCYSTKELAGYYNDMREKVLKNPEYLMKDGVPLTEVENGDPIFFPTCIFQFGLGAYDLYLTTKNDYYRKLFLNQCDWAMKYQNADGSWSVFENEYPDHPFGSMAQGEGTSLLLRAFKLTGNIEYFESAKKAIYFMITDVENNGTLMEENGKIFLKEFTHKEVVFNGWIFSIWGLFDYLLVCKDEKIKAIYDNTVNTLIEFLPSMDTGYWSKYDMGRAIASPFYHKLHIAQLEAMYQITGLNGFIEFKEKFEKYNASFIKKSRAFVKKSLQKVFEV